MDEQRGLIKEYLKVHKLKLRSLLDIYTEQIETSKLANETVTIKHKIDTIPTHIRDLDENISENSMRSQTVFSHGEEKKITKLTKVGRLNKNYEEDKVNTVENQEGNIHILLFTSQYNL